MIKNFNTIDQKLMMESQRQQRDNMNLKAQVDDLRRQLKDQKLINEPNAIDKIEIENLITELHKDMNSKINSLQDAAM